MIKFEINGKAGGGFRLEVHGDTAELAAEVGVLVGEIHEHYVKKNGLKAGAAFKASIWAVFEPGSPVWEVEEK